MLARLHATIVEKSPNAVVADVHGVGYAVRVTPSHAGELALNAETVLIIHTSVREDAITLYGFRTAAERALFEHLISVSGIGPKSAMGVLSIASPDDVRRAIRAGDATILRKVSGIGQKTAERIIVELREKVAPPTDGHVSSGGEEEAIDALVGLGYKQNEAREALRQVRGQTEGTSDLIKAALKVLSKQ